MPEAQATRRTSTTRKRPQKETVSPKIAQKYSSARDASSVQDRIRKWQTQDVAQAVDPDMLSVRSLPRSDKSRTPMRSHSPDQRPSEPQSTPRKRSTKWVQTENNTWVKQRRSVRGDRRGPGNTHLPVKEPLVKEPLVEISVREETPPLEFPRNESLRTRNVNSSRAERDRRRKRRREARARANNGRALVEDGIRVYAKSESHPASEPADRDTAPAYNAKTDEPGSAHDDISEPQEEEAEPANIEALRHSDCERTPGDQEEEGHWQPSKYAQTLGRAPETAETIEHPKTRKRAILDKTKEILIGRNDALPHTSNRIPSIEAWLEEQPDLPDPFVERDDDSVDQSNQAPKPPKHRSQHKKVSVEPTIVEVEDPNKIWDSVAPVQHRTPRKPSRRDPKNVSRQKSETSAPKRRLFSFEVCDEPDKGEECTPHPPFNDGPEPESSVTLKRRGAKTIKQARRPQLESPTAAKATSEWSLQQTEYLAEPKATQQQSPTKRPLPQLPSESAETFPGGIQNDIVQLDRLPSKGLKRKLTTHEDLLSVLSQPRARRSTKSNRSVRHAQRLSSEKVIREAMQTMQQEESQYIRELRTLVDGVTPVLLQLLLSKTDAAATVGLFSDNKNNDTDFTRPIIEMGGALQRLKSLHSRIPLQENDIDGLLAWAVTAHKPYSDYVRAWRLGFQGIIVNLAPLDESQMTNEDMLSRDVDGDITDEQGQKVDVAFLQKRPLIRIKKLSKFFAIIRDALPGHEKASTVADNFAELTETAKQRHGEEQGRLEDEAAADTDTTRARDIKTMGVADAVSIDRRRKVRARDYFDMTLQHSTGQRIDCKIEIILRDDPHPSGAGGDILICQVEETSKWLLFAPVHLSNVSARRDHSPCDLVLMVRGVAGIGRGWHEILALRAEEPEAVTEWLNMLGSNPLPPKLNYTASWQQPPERPQDLPKEPPLIVAAPTTAPTPLSHDALAKIQLDVDVPIGEPSVIFTRRKKQERQEKQEKQPSAKPEAASINKGTRQLSFGGGLQQKELPDRYLQSTSVFKQQPLATTRSPAQTSIASTIQGQHAKSHSPNDGQRRSFAVKNNNTQEPLVPRPQYSPQKFVYNQRDTSGTTATTRDSYFTEPEVQTPSRSQAQDETEKLMQAITNAERSWASEPLMSGALLPASPEDTKPGRGAEQNEVKDESNKVHSPASAHYPRNHSRTKTFSSSTPLSETIREQWAAISGFKKKHQSTPNTPERKASDNLNRNSAESPRVELRRESPPTIQQQLPRDPSPERRPPAESRPSPPPHQKSTYTISSSPQNSTLSLPISVRQETPAYPEATSPLKKEYQPSSSASRTESEEDDDDDDDETDATSDISDDVGSEMKDQATPLVTLSYGNRRTSHGPYNQKAAAPSGGSRTLDPSDSASNGPYRRAPPPSSYPANKKKRTIAMVCSWSDRGIWEPIQDDECSIVISPGLVQAFPMSAAHSQPMSGAEWEEGEQSSSPQQSPLVEFELTPVVPLRKGTALDITIRSPPTPNSTVTTTNNVMFRSRTVQECEKLYQYINWARCHNPIFAQLARDRPVQEPVTFASNVRPNKSRSWFSFGSREKTSYRAPSRPPASMADTAASSSSATSAFSALRRFGMNSPFSLKRSSVVRRPGGGTSGGSLYSSSNGTGVSSNTSTPPPSQAGFVPGRDGPNVPQTSAEAANGGGMVNNMKIRLFVRQGQKWEALGPSLLTVLPAAAAPANSPADSSGPPTPVKNATPPQRISRAPTSMPQPRTAAHIRLPSSGTTPHRIHGDGREKRILITNAKRKEIVLLDEILGESCFEKVMQTGIAVNVWKEDDEVQEYGGVMTGKSKTYMLQFRTSTEASWVFNMCGTYRYGNVAQSG